MKSKILLAALLASHVGAASAGSILYDFESGNQGWTTEGYDPTVLGNPTGGLNNWALGSSLPGNVGQALPGQWWTNGNNGFTLPNFDSAAERSGVLSPILTADATGAITVAFDSYTSNEGGYPDVYDVEYIQLAVNGGAFTDMHDFVAGLHDSTDQTFRSFAFTVGGISAGDPIQVRFLYDTGDSCCGPVDIMGWAFDNVEISGVTTVTEPGTVALAGLGLLGLALRRRRTGTPSGA
jgi:MYXO-CTERM domain-containing protein